MVEMKEGMMMVMSDMEWKETNSLAGLFQKIVADCKVSTLSSLYKKSIKCQHFHY